MNAAAVVVRWRGGDEVERCLRSLLDHGGPRLRRVILVDSGSGDGGAERLSTVFPAIEIVALDENLSFAHAANTGADHCDEELMLLLNPDTEIAGSTVTTLIEALEARPLVAGAAPVLANPDGTSQHRWQLRRLPTDARLASGRPGAPAFSSPPTTVSEVDQPAAAAWMVRMDVWRALDGFDEAYAPAWWEDVDFCARLHKWLADPEFPVERGFVVIPDARVLHQGGSSVSELSDTEFLAAYYRNLLLFAARHHPARLSLIGRALRCSLGIRGILRPSRRNAYSSASQYLSLNPPAGVA